MEHVGQFCLLTISHNGHLLNPDKTRRRFLSGLLGVKTPRRAISDWPGD
jgi:hypothetical protein